MEQNLKDIIHDSPFELAKKIVCVLDDKKAHGIKLLHVENQTIIADYFVICSGTSNTQIKGLSGALEEEMMKHEIEAKHVEGYNEASWVLLDYSSVIVHIFNRESRDFYNLEKLWIDSTDVNIQDLIKGKE